MALIKLDRCKKFKIVDPKQLRRIFAFVFGMNDNSIPIEIMKMINTEIQSLEDRINPRISKCNCKLGRSSNLWCISPEYDPSTQTWKYDNDDKENCSFEQFWYCPKRNEVLVRSISDYYLPRYCHRGYGKPKDSEIERCNQIIENIEHDKNKFNFDIFTHKFQDGFPLFGDGELNQIKEEYVMQNLKSYGIHRDWITEEMMKGITGTNTMIKAMNKAIERYA